MRAILSLAGFLLLLVPAADLRGAPLDLWPSDLCDVRANGSGKVEICDSGRLCVRTGAGDSWPGAALFFKAGPRDLSGCGAVRVAVRNVGEHPLTIRLSVKGRGQKGSSPGGDTTLEPGATGEIVARLHTTPWVLDKPLELVGMRGYPKAFGDGGFDPRKVSELHVFVAKPDAPASFEVIRAVADRRAYTPLKSEGFLPFVDRFGQFAHADWPGKIHSESDLAAAAAEEERWLSEHGAPADWDRWGGWATGPQREATGHFRTEKLDGKWWLIDPDGRLFFSHGVDCVRAGAETGISARERYFVWLPEKGDPLARFFGRSAWAPHGFYKDHGPFRTFDFARVNLVRKHGEEWESAFAALAHRRIRAWGLNTVANWSEPKVYLLRKTPYTATLGTGRAPRIEGSDGWWGKFPDPHSPEFEARIRAEAMAQRGVGTAEDPWCIGYFVDNEMSWGKDDRALARAALLSPATQPAKIEFRRWLQGRHEGIAALNAAWGTAHASWDAFLACATVPDEKRCGADLEAFHARIAERYFRVIRDAVRAAAPNKLYLGCRIAWGAPSVYRAAAKYCDVVSVNTYKRAVEKDLPEGSEDRPLINGEFHFGALDRGMFHTGLVATASQEERAQAYRDFLASCLAHPRYVGAHWFQWRDQALTGRGDGENYQIGFVTVADRPYPELVRAARDVAATMYATRRGNQARDAGGR